MRKCPPPHLRAVSDLRYGASNSAAVKRLDGAEVVLQQRVQRSVVAACYRFSEVRNLGCALYKATIELTFEN